MERDKKIIDLGILSEDEATGVKKVSLVEEPAIMLDFRYFGKQYSFVKPRGGESQDEFISRCIPVLINEGKPDDQAAAICYSYWKEGFAGVKVSFDYHETLNTEAGKELAKKAIADGEDVYVISAGKNKEEFMPLITELGIDPSKVFATGSNKAKIEKIKELGIEKHYDNNQDVIDELGAVGQKFNIEKFESYNDYPESAKTAAKRALEWRDAHPEQECGTPVGWARANQLAKGENISEETIARMASFARHLQYKDVPYSEGCGGLMVDAWGGQAGIEWAQNKLKELRGEDFEIDTAGLAPYVDPYIKKKNGKAEAPVTKAILASAEEVIDYEWTKDAYVVETILELARNLGATKENLQELFDYEMKFANVSSAAALASNPSEATQTKNRELTVYKYEGSIGENSREFCTEMVSIGRFYTKANIQAMSDIAVNAGFGRNGAATYSIWSFKGGPNCKHVWNEYVIKATADGKVMEPVDLGRAAGNAGIKPYDMPKHGYYNAMFKLAEEDKMILVGPAMVPNISIPRIDEDGEKYFVRFSPETIKEICMKYFKEARTNDVNTDHEENEAGAYIFESWIVEDPETDKANTIYGYNVPEGTWMVTMKVDNKETWARIKAGELRGFSIEGILADMEELEAKKKYEKIKKILG